MGLTNPATKVWEIPKPQTAPLAPPAPSKREHERAPQLEPAKREKQPAGV